MKMKVTTNGTRYRVMHTVKRRLFWTSWVISARDYDTSKLVPFNEDNPNATQLCEFDTFEEALKFIHKYNTSCWHDIDVDDPQRAIAVQKALKELEMAAT